MLNARDEALVGGGKLVRLVGRVLPFVGFVLEQRPSGGDATLLSCGGRFGFLLLLELSHELPTARALAEQKRVHIVTASNVALLAQEEAGVDGKLTEADALRGGAFAFGGEVDELNAAIVAGET